MANKPLPEGRVGRLLRMASVGARSGASLLLSKEGSATAERVADVLGQLRGLAAKAGQTLSYVDGIIPEQHRATYERALGTLQAATPASDPTAIQQVVETELAAPLDRLFAEWNPLPIASASIGQVHRARLHDGREVAVKVQHPGIEKALEADLNNAGILESLVSTLGPRTLGTKAILRIVRQRFLEELDYCLEARHQTEFRRMHAGDPLIHVPSVIESHSRRRVLTSEFVVGHSLDFAALAPEAQRRTYAETLWRFVFKGNLVFGMFNADPHPGNYFFHDDGSVTFIDFGCVQPIEGEHLLDARRVHLSAMRGEHSELERAFVKLLGTRGGVFERLTLDFCLQCFRPLLESPFLITRAYAASLVKGAQQLKPAIFSKDKSFVPPPPSMVFMNRLQFGFYSVLARLEVEADYAAVERRFFLEAGIG